MQENTFPENHFPVSPGSWPELLKKQFQGTPLYDVTDTLTKQPGHAKYTRAVVKNMS